MRLPARDEPAGGDCLPALAEFDNVVKLYGAHQALGPVTVKLPEGSVGLLGPNGAGKSTFIRLMLGLLPPTSGSVRVLGEDVAPGNRLLRTRIGYVPEGNAVFPDLTGVEAVAYAGRLVGMPKAEALQRAHQVLDYVELGEERYRFVDNYSTGMRQRLKLAQALVHDPELLVLDEPTEGVDPEARGAILDLLTELEREHGLKLLISTHILHDVERLATHALVLSEGRVVAHGSLEELRKAQSNAFVVRVHGPQDALTAHLSQAGVQWSPYPPGVRVELEDPRAVLKHVNDAGLVVRHLAPATLTLEEAFDQAVGGGA